MPTIKVEICSQAESGWAAQGQGTDTDDAAAQLNEEEQLLVIGRLHQARFGALPAGSHACRLPTGSTHQLLNLTRVPMLSEGMRGFRPAELQAQTAMRLPC